MVWLVLFIGLRSCCTGEPGIVGMGAMEKLALFSPEAVKDWRGEECTTEASMAHVKDAPVSLHWHVTVDHKAGEKKYPIGWPRFGRSLKDGRLRDWSGWDYLHGWIFTETSREVLPREPAGLSINASGDDSDYHQPLTALKKDEWTELLIPVSQIEHAADVQHVQFHISESTYNHGDRLDFFISDLALLRHAVPRLIEFAAESTVMFADIRRLPVRLQLAGVSPDKQLEVTCELRLQGRTVAHMNAQALRGTQRVTLDLSHKKLAPGEYELAATIAGNPQPVTAKLRLVESPWR